ncbi:hypothetical protein GCM10028826_36720 [Mucilaginibacter boryungensis]
MYLISCSVNHEIVKPKSGDYQWQVTHSSQASAPVICGTVNDFDTKKPLGKNGAIKINQSVKQKTDLNGGFSFKVEPGKYAFTIVAFPYDLVTTKKIQVNLGDSVKLKVYLKPSSEPMVD